MTGELLIIILNQMARKFPIPAVLIVLALTLSCSHEQAPYHAPYLVEGKVSIENQSGVRIILREFTQRRGNDEVTVMLNRGVNDGFVYYFRNQIDGGNSDIFPGGDYIEVHYVAAVSYPGDPNRPLFDQTLSHTVNGITVYYVKSGGRYTVQP